MQLFLLKKGIASRRQVEHVLRMLASKTVVAKNMSTYTGGIDSQLDFHVTGFVP